MFPVKKIGMPADVMKKALRIQMKISEPGRKIGTENVCVIFLRVRGILDKYRTAP